MRTRELLCRVRERRDTLKLQMGQLTAQLGELDLIEKLLVLRPKAAKDRRVADRAERAIVANSDPAP